MCANTLDHELSQTVLYYAKACSISPNWISGLDMRTSMAFRVTVLAFDVYGFKLQNIIWGLKYYIGIILY